MSAGMRRLRVHGFTLLETLVALTVLALAATLMFQALDAYRLAQARVASVAGGIDRAQLFGSWWSETIQGLSPGPDPALRGDERTLAGHTLNPLFASPGAPTEFGWRIERSRDGEEIVYLETGVERWRTRLREPARFVFFDASGAEHAAWPPELGEQDGLPAGIALVRGEGPLQELRFASVRGPLHPVELPFQLEQE